MPITPFHFGPGLLAKGLAPRHFSFSAFAVTEVLVDVETVVNLQRQRWPIHAELHTLVGSLSVGLAVGIAMYLGGKLLPANIPMRQWGHTVESEVSLRGGLAGGLLGGLTASLLDALMHGDVAPFWPVVAGNSVHGMVGLVTLHLGCVLAGLVGGFLWWTEFKATAT